MDVVHLLDQFGASENIPVIPTASFPETDVTSRISQSAKHRRFERSPSSNDAFGEWTFQIVQQHRDWLMRQVGNEQHMNMIRHDDPCDESE